MPIHCMRLNLAPFGRMRDGGNASSCGFMTRRGGTSKSETGSCLRIRRPRSSCPRVMGLRAFASLDDLYQALALEACGYPF